MYHCGNFWCRVGIGASVLNGIEAALWDLKGKILGIPVFELLGGYKRDDLPCYPTGGSSNFPKEKLITKIDFHLSLGFRVLKIGAGSYTPEACKYLLEIPEAAADYEAQKMDFVRTHVRKDIKIMMDGHMGNSISTTWDYGTAFCYEGVGINRSAFL